MIFQRFLANRPIKELHGSERLLHPGSRFYTGGPLVLNTVPDRVRSRMFLSRPVEELRPGDSFREEPGDEDTRMPADRRFTDSGEGEGPPEAYLHLVKVSKEIEAIQNPLGGPSSAAQSLDLFTERLKVESLRQVCIVNQFLTVTDAFVQDARQRRLAVSQEAAELEAEAALARAEREKLQQERDARLGFLIGSSSDTSGSGQSGSTLPSILGRETVSVEGGEMPSTSSGAGNDLQVAVRTAPLVYNGREFETGARIIMVSAVLLIFQPLTLFSCSIFPPAFRPPCSWLIKFLVASLLTQVIWWPRQTGFSRTSRSPHRSPACPS